VFPAHSNVMRRKYTGSRRFLPYIFVLGCSKYALIFSFLASTDFSIGRSNRN
jgi:hypothetical protein